MPQRTSSPPLVPLIPHDVSSEAIGQIYDHYGDDLATRRAEDAQKRLAAEVAVGEYHLGLIPAGLRTEAITACMVKAKACQEATEGSGSDTKTRLIRAAGRVLVQAVMNASLVEQAASRENVSERAIRTQRKLARCLAADALQATEDSFILFAGGGKTNRDNARRVLGLTRAELKLFRAHLTETERGAATRSKRVKPAKPKKTESHSKKHSK